MPPPVPIAMLLVQTVHPCKIGRGRKLGRQVRGGQVQINGFGQFIFWAGGSLYIGSAVAPSEFHRHHAIQLSLGLDGKVQFKTAADADWIEYDGAVIPSDRLHTFQAPGRTLAHIFCEPESFLGRLITRRFAETGIAALASTEAQLLAAPLKEAHFRDAPQDELVALALGALRLLAGDDVEPAAIIDPRIRRAMDEIERRLEEPVTLTDIATFVRLSAGRFRHLFVSETGISFRAFVLWARLNRALALGYSGASWTEAAHAANFADSAHLTRTCRRMFGITPASNRDSGAKLLSIRTA